MSKVVNSLLRDPFALTGQGGHNMQVLVCSPDFYKVPGPDKHGQFKNIFQKRGWEEQQKDPTAFRAKAQTQHKALVEVLCSISGVQLHKIIPQADEIDAVFTADASISGRVVGNLFALASQFSNADRVKEPATRGDFFRERLETARERFLVWSSHYNMEGTGDNVYDPYRGVFLSGYLEGGASADKASAGRSDQRAHKFLSHVFGVDVKSLPVEAPFYHIDTALAPLPRGEMLVYPGGIKGFDAAAFKQTYFEDFDLDPKTHYFELTTAEAQLFGANVRVLGNDVIIHKNPGLSRVTDYMRGRGYKVHEVDLSAFLASGGSAHCLTNYLDELFVPGGYAGNKQYRYDTMPKPALNKAYLSGLSYTLVP